MLYLMCDPVHLFKNIRNNWVSEKTQILKFREPGTHREVTATWKDLISVYKEESNNMLKLTKLDHQTLWPNNFEKQKVHLVCNVFNEKTCAVLQQKKYGDTSIFINCVTRMWNILNIKSPAVEWCK